MRSTGGAWRTQERRHLRRGFTRCSKDRSGHNQLIERRSNELNAWEVLTQPRRWDAPDWKSGSHSWRAHPCGRCRPHSKVSLQAIESARLVIAMRTGFVRPYDAVSLRPGTARATGGGVRQTMAPEHLLSMGMVFAPGSRRVVRERRHGLADEEPWFS